MTKKSNNSSLPIKYLQECVIRSLGDSLICHSDVSIKPLVVKVGNPSPHKFRLYVFNCSNPPGGRPIGEYKIVLHVGQELRQPGNFDYSDGCIAIPIGYVEQLDVFVLWDASKHKNFAYNKNLQVRAATLFYALANPIAIQPRSTRNGTEIIIASRSEYLLKALSKRMELLFEEILQTKS